MSKYICKIGTVEDVEKKFDYEIEKAIDNKSNWIIWKDKAINRVKDNKMISYMGLLDDIIICECSAAIDKSIVQNSDGLIDNKTSYLYAFRTNEEYQGQGYFSKLFKFMIDDLKKKGYTRVTLGVEPEDLKNKAIYKKLGFNKFIKKATEVYPDGTKIEVEYYEKEIED